MAKNSPTDTSGHKPKWFARRQVYLRAGQDSQYVELSPMLQIGVAIGFGALALWLIGASYGAITSFGDRTEQTALLAKLGSTEQALEDAERTRAAALADATRIAELEAELVKAQAAATDSAEASDDDQTLALTTELEQTKAQLEDLHLRLSESKADQAALQARFEAEDLATSDASAKTAEEAASLHAQLEEAFDEVATLQKERDEVIAKLAAAEEDAIAKGETTERNTALLKAATAEIERLQNTIAAATTEAESEAKKHEAALAEVEAERDEAVAIRDELERKVAELNADLETAGAAAEAGDTGTAADANFQVQSIAAGLKEADLLAEIDDLRAELDADKVGKDPLLENEPITESEDVIALRERVVLAETELERLILAGLKAEDAPSAEPTAAEDDPAESERLRAELLTAQADIIKLNADVRAAKQRLAEKAASDGDQASKPDNSAKLEQQLASTRSRVQQLNKALSDAKLREVAIDLALINVVPSPSPPAPR